VGILDADYLSANPIFYGTPSAAGYEDALRGSSVVQCGQRVALIGIVIAQAGQSFETAGASGAERFILFIALTTRKMQNATTRKLITSVMKFP